MGTACSGQRTFHFHLYVKGTVMDDTRTSGSTMTENPGGGMEHGYGDRQSTQRSSQSSLVTGLFPDRDSAEKAWQSASELGYRQDDINVVMSDDTRKRYFAGGGPAETELGNKAAEGAGIGGAIGGTVGAIAAAIAAMGTSLVLPGLGLVVAGPLAAGLAGAGAGGAAGSLVGALVGWGIPEERVREYESGIQNGGILMGIKPRSDDEADQISQRWTASNGQHIAR